MFLYYTVIYVWVCLCFADLVLCVQGKTLWGVWDWGVEEWQNEGENSINMSFAVCIYHHVIQDHVVKDEMGRVCRMHAMNGKYAAAAWYVCGEWHKVAYRSLSVTPSVGACGVMLPCFTCWSAMCDGMLIETNAPPPHVACRVTVSSTVQLHLPAVTFQAQPLSVCLCCLAQQYK
jgi:hypothetical protein